MRRVVVTGMGIVSSLGVGLETVNESLRQGRSGLVFSDEAREAGLRSHVCGGIDFDLEANIDRRLRRFMCPGAGYAWQAMREAIACANLDEGRVRSERTGLVAGAGGNSSVELIDAVDTHRERGIRKVGPFRVPKTMSSSINACLSTAYGIRGINYGITSACATSAHAIGHAADLIALGRQDVMFAGGGEDVHWTLSMLFDAMGALSTRYNETPERASRTYDADRDGFVISGGAGMLVLESLEHAQERGAEIIAEFGGFGATSDGADMVQPSGEGAARCMRQAMATVDEPIAYINTHGTSTPAGDIVELESIAEVFGGDIPPLSSTKPLTGHSLGAAGVHEAIYCLLMQRGRFITPSANIERLDERAEGYPIVRERREDIDLPVVMSNSFGFGGTNASLVFKRSESH
ncbi:beta-ketoacyl-ACP synthase I [Wenzhouxiangella sp. XN201]|uniref:beta-ketoacyl synthase N-terminal-like domain-containing protein n=1 Tax=Wenzhouxiangella sp. XN201 TaxID=2710755 RepID=UPI0013C87C07|nr:beta-ketoacyl synthase N-terminal-like domain-containing protein [Wenzhouxiangella sp. XN201]NEZ02708.1 beta-ketoacyl-ACP synthase I [Wenzhouxiangella sp. XN201]